MWRCLNDIWGYCSEEPEPETEPKKALLGDGKVSGFLIDGTCKLDPKTCGKFQAFSESLAARPITKQAEGFF